MDKLLRVINGGTCYLLDHETQDRTELNFNGRMVVSKTATLWHAQINAGGALYVYGFVGSVDVKRHGTIVVKKGGHVGFLIGNAESNVYIEKGGYVQDFHDNGCDLQNTGFIKSTVGFELCSQE